MHNLEKCRASARAWREANPEAFKQSVKDSHRRHREKINAQRRARRKQNVEDVRAKKKAWREANREKVLAQKRAHYHANREKLLARAEELRQARLLGKRPNADTAAVRLQPERAKAKIREKVQAFRSQAPATDGSKQLG